MSLVSRNLFVRNLIGDKLVYFLYFCACFSFPFQASRSMHVGEGCQYRATYDMFLFYISHLLDISTVACRLYSLTIAKLMR